MSQTTIVRSEHPKTWLERYKKYQPKGWIQSAWKVATNHAILTWNQKHQGQLMTYASGKILIIDGDFWGENIKYYFGEVKNTLLEWEQSLRKYGLAPLISGVIYDGEKIPWGFHETHLGFYLINRNAIEQFTSTILWR